jgi:RNA 2',3'-cyclic 3'-phosphodiesterase
MTKKRIFVAIDIPGEAKDRVASYTNDLKHEFRDLRVKWERREKLHITVKFAGSIDEEELVSLTSLVNTTVVGLPDFTIRIDGTGAFLKRRGANVLWLGLSASYPQTEQNPWTNLAAHFDVKRSNKAKREFRPHLTIARLKDPRNARDLVARHLNSEFESVEFEATELVIYESKLLPAGSVYKEISRHPFGFPASAGPPRDGAR